MTEMEPRNTPTNEGLTTNPQNLHNVNVGGNFMPTEPGNSEGDQHPSVPPTETGGGVAGGGERTPTPPMSPREEQERAFRAFRNRVTDHFSKRPQDQDIKEQKELQDIISSMIEDEGAVEATTIPSAYLEIASHFREKREELINRILFKAYEDPGETNEYRESINLYSGSNLDNLLSYLLRQDPKKHADFVGLRSAAQLYHTMNATLIAGNLNQFINIAQNLNYGHFTLMQKIPGSSEAMRLYEQKYNDYLAQYGRISTEGYEQLKKDVADTLSEMNDKGLLKSDYAEERAGEKPEKMLDWELRRALNVGRTFFNITFRGAEKIASGQVPREGGNNGTEGNKRYSSFPQESGSKIMNWMQWVAYRFEIADVRGGMAFLEIVKKNYFEFLKEKKRKLEINKIKKFGGMDTEELEVGAMFGVNGVYSSWRIENMAFTEIKTKIKGENGVYMSIKQWVDKNANSEIIKGIKKNYKDEGKRRMKYLEVLKPLIDNTDLGLGILLKHNLFSGDIGEIAYEARKAVWQKVSQNNLPTIINYLSGLEMRQGGEPVQSIEEILRNEKVRTGRDWNKKIEIPNVNGSKNSTEWEILKEKIFLRHERQIKLAMDTNRNDIPEIVFSNEEQHLMDKIKAEGLKLAPHLADIVFPYIPFMNDVPFENLNYAGPGNEFYNRRNGDIASFEKAEQAFTSIMGNPGVLGVEDALKQFSQIVEGIGSPQGITDAQERVYPMFEAWIDYIRTKPWKSQVVWKAFNTLIRNPTSLAQQYSGLLALSTDEFQTSEIIEHALKNGILSPALEEELKKKKKLGISGILWAILRDILPVGLIGGVTDATKQVTKMGR